MARSRRRTPIFPFACVKAGEMRKYRRYVAHAERVRVREKIARGDYDALSFHPHWDEWSSPRDGKHYWRSAPSSAMRK